MEEGVMLLAALGIAVARAEGAVMLDARDAESRSLSSNNTWRKKQRHYWSDFLGLLLLLLIIDAR